MLVPVVLSGADLRQAHRFVALSVIFISIVCITGYSGHITLGQAAIAGAGGFFTARAANAWDVPVLVAMLAGIGAALLLGLIAGYPALRRKGLFLGLTTLALALLVDRFIFNNPDSSFFSGGPGGLTVQRPTFLSLDLSGDVAFYFYELVVLGLVLFLARNLRTGRLGRVLAAMRDSETAARSIGIGMRRSKLFVFGVSAAIAGIGGALLTQAEQNFDSNTFNPVFGLFWFTAVVVCGISSTGRAHRRRAVHRHPPHHGPGPAERDRAVRPRRRRARPAAGRTGRAGGPAPDRGHRARLGGGAPRAGCTQGKARHRVLVPTAFAQRLLAERNGQ